MKKILGLVLELNPPHNGHKYFIDRAKSLVNPDYTIAVVSSSFSMRGEPMVIDKFTKTKLMLELGIDIVMELPIISSLNHADYFAYNSISILKDMGVNNIAFGVENDDLSVLMQIVDYLDDPAYQMILKSFIDKGNSYSNSSLKALTELTKSQDIGLLSTLPNNTLGIQYLRSLRLLKFNPEVHLIKRIENNYYDSEASSSIASATAIRNLLNDNKDLTSYIPQFEVPIKFINQIKSEEMLFKLLKYQFSTKDISYFHNILGVNEGIENRFKTFLYQCDDLNSFIKIVQTKRYTLNRIKRLILAIVLDIPKSYECTYNYYLRILGMSAKGTSYLRSLTKEIKNSIITSFENSNNPLVLLEQRTTRLYELLTDQKIFNEEFKVPYKEI